MKIAITGGIGSGKSTLVKILKKLGYSCVSFDEVYKSLCAEERFVKRVCEVTGTNAITRLGKIEIDKEAIAERAFGSPEILKNLNAFTHAEIFKRAFEEGEPMESGVNPVFYEVPLLFEGDYQNLFDDVWVVVRDKKVRIAAAALRDGKKPEQIEQRVKNQIDYDKTDLSAHTLIANDENDEQLEIRVKRVLSEKFGQVF